MLPGSISEEDCRLRRLGGTAQLARPAKLAQDGLYGQDRDAGQNARPGEELCESGGRALGLSALAFLAPPVPGAGPLHQGFSFRGHDNNS